MVIPKPDEWWYASCVIDSNDNSRFFKAQMALRATGVAPRLRQMRQDASSDQ